MLLITLTYTPVSEMLACNKNTISESTNQVYARNLWGTKASTLSLFATQDKLPGTESFLKISQVQLGKRCATVFSQIETLHGPGKLLKHEGN